MAMHMVIALSVGTHLWLKGGTFAMQPDDAMYRITEKVVLANGDVIYNMHGEMQRRPYRTGVLPVLGSFTASHQTVMDNWTTGHGKRVSTAERTVAHILRDMHTHTELV
jgi:hypothetical protein